MSSSQFSFFLDGSHALTAGDPLFGRSTFARWARLNLFSVGFGDSCGECGYSQLPAKSQVGDALRLEIRITVMSFYALCEVVDVFAASLLSDPDADARIEKCPGTSNCFAWRARRRQ